MSCRVLVHLMYNRPRLPYPTTGPPWHSCSKSPHLTTSPPWYSRSRSPYPITSHPWHSRSRSPHLTTSHPWHSRNRLLHLTTGPSQHSCSSQPRHSRSKSLHSWKGKEKKASKEPEPEQWEWVSSRPSTYVPLCRQFKGSPSDPKRIAVGVKDLLACFHVFLSYEIYDDMVIDEFVCKSTACNER